MAELVTLDPNVRSEKKSATRFHISLNVRDLATTIGFFRAFFGCEPAKCRADYAKFELADPPLVMSLEPYAAPAGGNLNHLGFRVPDSATLVEMQRRLELAGISTKREEGVECCYARQTKFWVHDPDGNLWEVYTLDEDLEHRGDGHLPAVSATSHGDVADDRAASIWNHRLGQPFPTRLPILDATVDRVLLEGSFNEPISADEISRRCGEVLRVLKPGGRIHLHMLTADRDLGDAPVTLPGPAAAVKAVPVDQAILSQLAASGFQNPRFVLRGNSPCFRVGEAELRETRIEAEK